MTDLVLESFIQTVYGAGTGIEFFASENCEHFKRRNRSSKGEPVTKPEDDDYAESLRNVFSVVPENDDISTSIIFDDKSAEDDDKSVEDDDNPFTLKPDAMEEPKPPKQRTVSAPAKRRSKTNKKKGGVVLLAVGGETEGSDSSASTIEPMDLFIGGVSLSAQVVDEQSAMTAPMNLPVSAASTTATGGGPVPIDLTTTVEYPLSSITGGAVASAMANVKKDVPTLLRKYAKAFWPPQQVKAGSPQLAPPVVI